jgi:hypothetical protein
MTVLHDGSRFVPQLELEFNVVLDSERLRDALALLARRHPILQATVDLSRPRAVWRAGSTSPVLVDAVDEVELDPSVGPTCRLAHLRDESRSRLQFGLHHAVADGRSLVVLLDDLRALYVALATGEQPLVDVDWTDRTIGALLATSRVGLADRARMGWDAAQQWAASPRSTHRDDNVASEQGAAPEPAGDATTHFERTDVGAIQGAGAASGWRRNHVFLAILARAWLDVIGHEPATTSVSGWLVTVDCRRQLGVARGVGNLSGLEPVRLVDIESLSLRETVDAASRAFVPLGRPGAGMVADLASPGSGLAPGPLLDRAIGSTFAARAAGYRYTRFFSHLDRLPDSLADWGDAELLGVRWCPNPPSAPPYVAMLLATFRETTSLTIVASPRALAPERARALADRASETLGDLAGEVSASVG